MQNSSFFQSQTGSADMQLPGMDSLFTRMGMWYFRTGDGKDIGPFRYRDEAELMLTRFVQDLQQQRAQQALLHGKPHFRISAKLGSEQAS